MNVAPESETVGLYPTEREQLIQAMHALADDACLSLLRFIAAEQHTIEHIATQLQMTEATVDKHLHRLRTAGLVNLRMQGQHRHYQTKTGALEAISELLRRVTLPQPPESVIYSNAWIDDLGVDDETAAILDSHFNGHELLRIPKKLKAMIVVIDYLATKFAPGRFYTEAQVNAVLQVHHPDVATLRRALIDHKHMARDRHGNSYWLLGEPVREPHANP